MSDKIVKPITREETFLAAAGGQSVELPEPVTRKEMLLKAVAENSGGGSGSGGNVPAGGNEGQVLTKRSGENYDTEWQDIPQTSWYDLKDKPFGDEYVFIEWDGNTEGKEVIDEHYYKVSDFVFPHDYPGGSLLVNGEWFDITDDMVSYDGEWVNVSMNGKVYVKEHGVEPYGVYFLDDGTERVEIVDKTYTRKLDPRYTTQVHADWYINDPEDPSFVYGRTHWSEYEQNEPVQIAESDLVWEDTGASLDGVPIKKAEGTNDTLANTPIYVGQFLTVIWGENEGGYGAIAYDPANYGIEFEGGVLIGSAALHPNGENKDYDSGEPFLMLLRGGEYIFYARETQLPTPYVSLESANETVYPLDEKYIPDSIMRVRDLPKQEQSDQSCNDESSAAFIKNRTHWMSGEAVQINGTASFYASLGTDVNSPMGYIFQEGTLDIYDRLTVGNIYNVRLPLVTGDEYIALECIEKGVTKSFGNMETNGTDDVIQGGAEDFRISIFQDSVMILTKTGYFESQPLQESIAYEISVDTTEYHPLDEKFIPESIARKEPVEEAIAEIVSTMQESKKHTFGKVYFQPTVNTDVEMRMLSSIYRENGHIAIQWEDKMFEANSVFKLTFALNFEADAEASFTINSASIGFGTQGTIPAGKSQQIVEFVVDVPFLSGGLGHFTLNDLKFNCTGAVTLKDSYYSVEEYQMD